MNDREAQEERADLISRTFALITAKCEDAATLAAESQGRQPSDVLRENAEKLQDLMSETSTVIDCVTALLTGREA